MSLKNVDRYRLALALTRAVNLIHKDAAEHCYLDASEYQDVIHIIVGFKDGLEENIHYTSQAAKEEYSKRLKVSFK